MRAAFRSALAIAALLAATIQATSLEVCLNKKNAPETIVDELPWMKLVCDNACSELESTGAIVTEVEFFDNPYWFTEMLMNYVDGIAMNDADYSEHGARLDFIKRDVVPYCYDVATQ